MLIGWLFLGLIQDLATLSTPPNTHPLVTCASSIAVEFRSAMTLANRLYKLLALDKLATLRRIISQHGGAWGSIKHLYL